jgi:hypothetical protein
MRQLILVISLVLCVIHSQSQDCKEKETLVCTDSKPLPLKIAVVINGYSQRNTIKKSDILKYGVGITLGDPSYKFIGFKLVYDCHAKSVLDFSMKTYTGNKVAPNDQFIERMWVGDQLVFDCINVEKGGQKYLIHGVVLDVL